MSGNNTSGDPRLVGFIVHELLQAEDSAIEVTCDRMRNTFDAISIAMAVQEIRSLTQDDTMELMERERLQNVANRVGRRVLFGTPPSLLRTSTYGTIDPVALPFSRASTTNFSNPDRIHDSMLTMNGSESILQEQVERIAGEVDRRLRKAVIRFLGDHGEYDPETRQLRRSVKETLPPRSYEDEIVSHMIIPAYPEAFDDVDAIKRKIGSILEALRKSLEGTQSRKTFFEEYCNTFSSTDPCKIKEMHTEVESAQGSEGYANQGTSLPKPHGNLTSYKVVAASKDEEVFYSIGECQAACLGHGEEECSCPVGYISIVVTAVTEPPLAREHMVHLEDFEFPLDEESGIRFIPTVGIQTNQTLQWPEKLLICIEETRAQAQEREKKQTVAMKELQRIKAILSKLEGILSSLTKKKENPQNTLLSITKHLEDFETNKSTKASELTDCIKSLCDDFLSKSHEDRYNEEVRQMQQNAMTTSSEIYKIRSELEQLLEEKRERKKEEEERKAVARMRQQENTPLNIDPSTLIDLTNCVTISDCEARALSIRTAAAENAEEVQSLCNVRGRVQDDTLQEKMTDIEKRVSFAGNLLDAINKISHKCRESVRISCDKKETNDHKSRCNKLLKEYKAKLKRRQANARKRELQEEDIKNTKKAKDYRTM